MKAKVISSRGHWHTIKSENGVVYQAQLRGNLRLKLDKSTSPVVVGDNVFFEPKSGQENQAIISDIEPRRNFIARKSVNLSKQTHILASNIDMAFLVVTIESPETTTTFIDRFLAAAESYSIETVLVFNKIDLYDSSVMERKNEIENIYKSIGYKTVSVSAIEKTGLEDLKSLMKNKSSMLSGHSGSGKSSIINSIDESLNIKIGEISKIHKQGRHTTTFAQMYELSFGGFIVDTPGIRGFGSTYIKKEEVDSYFPELFALKKSCKYYNCLHLNEPGCAVKNALENGEIAPSRYLSYLSIIEEYEGDSPYREDKYKL